MSPSETQPDDLPNEEGYGDANPKISLATSRTYWESVSADNNGMLGGYAHVSTNDLRASKTFITLVRNLLRPTGTTPTKPSTKIEYAVDCGAGIGRITKGLLVNVADTVDVVEPISKFAAEIEKSEFKVSGQVDRIFVQGLEEWEPPGDRRYGLIWNQWCVGHLTDEQLVAYLRRAAGGLSGCDGHQGEKGWIMVKENVTGHDFGDWFDEVDSSVTRSDQKFRQIFRDAGLRIIKSKSQDLKNGLYPIMMYALRPN